jgi:hypothetical protein
MYIPLTFEGALQSCLYAQGGYEQGFFLSGSQQYAFHLFNKTGSQQLQVLAGTLNNVSIAVAGGGGGGASADGGAGGGGGGGVIVSQNNILYAGTYGINVGRGGSGGAYQTTQSNPGETGSPTSISGTNLYFSVDGGKGGSGNTGGDSGAPTAFSGSAGTALRGGGGGGSAGNATPATLSPNVAGTGGPGITASFGGEAIGAFTPAYSKVFGSGANGSGAAIDDPYSQFGRGGIGVVRSTGNSAQAGRDGCVIVQYPINNYCKNWFNQTGSCGCSQATFRIEEVAGGFYADLTGSFAYTPCGTNTIASGSLISYFPQTVCAVSNSYYWQLNSDTNGAQVGRSGFVGGNNCFSASYGVQTCTTQSFIPTCTSSIVTFQAGTGSTSPQTVFWVPKNESNIQYTTIPNGSVTYKCISSGSIYSGSIAIYPAGISGIGSRILTSSVTCSTVTFTSTAASSYRYYRYQTCGGAPVADRFFGAGTITDCVDLRFPYGFYFVSTTNTTVTTGSSCLSSVIDTGSCGCP